MPSHIGVYNISSGLHDQRYSIQFSYRTRHSTTHIEPAHTTPSRTLLPHTAHSYRIPHTRLTYTAHRDASRHTSSPHRAALIHRTSTYTRTPLHIYAHLYIYAHTSHTQVYNITIPIQYIYPLLTIDTIISLNYSYI